MTGCPKCGNTIPENAPANQCPHCLVRAGLNDGDASHPRETLSGPRASRFRTPSVEQLVTRFPQLEILELLGAGGMGAVYKARQRGLDRLVALKILPPEIGNDSSFAERFTREARALARLNHTNIVTVYDFGQTSSTPTLFYIVMEFVDGVNLRQLIQANELPPTDALAIVPQICEALQFAHDDGIVHRDIKPENILIDKKGRVKIADFGLAKLLGTAPNDEMLTGSHQVLGTLRYMAPEQMEGSPSVDHRADIYSLGVVFYEMLTGELPLGRFAPPSEKIHLDVRLDEVVLRSLAREPERRYQQASQFKTDVDGIISSPGSPVSKTPVNKTGADIELFRMQFFSSYSLLVVAGLALAWFFSFAFIPVLGAAGLLIVFYSLLCLISLRTVILEDRGLTVQRILGSPKFLSWKDVVRVTPVSRLQVLHDIVFGCSPPTNGPAVGLPVKHYFRIAGTKDAWFFCPKDPSAFVFTLRSHDCRVDARSQPEVQTRQFTNWLWISVLAVVLVVCLIAIISSYLIPRGEQTTMKMISPSMEDPPRPLPSWEDVSRPGWRSNSDGVNLNDQAIAILGLNQKQRQEVNQILTAIFADYLAIESKNTQRTVSEDGHSVATIRPFPKELTRLEDRLWTQLDAVLNVEQQKLARLNLPFDPPSVVNGIPVSHMVGPGLFGWGENGAVIETWSVGAWKHWRIKTRGYDYKSEGPDLPYEYRRFWVEPSNRQPEDESQAIPDQANAGHDGYSIVHSRREPNSQLDPAARSPHFRSNAPSCLERV